MKKNQKVLKLIIIGIIVLSIQIALSTSSKVYAEESNSTSNEVATTTQKKSITQLKNKINTSVHTYTGEKRTPSVKLYDENKTLKEGTDYKVTYKNNKKTGRAQIIVKGKGNYTGTLKKYFFIAPKKAKITKVESSSDFKKATITWKKDDMASGYTIYMSEKKDGEYKKIKTIKSKSIDTYTKSKLKPKKTYYFKVRSYKLIGATGEKVYSKKYSNAKMRSNLLAEVTLTAHGSGANRKYNLKKACNTVSGTILKPGETFNWFKVVGAASGAKGYKLASVYKNGTVTKGYGGGVCQVSSTIYQASKKSGLEIVERHIHSRPVTYTKLGNDATVSYGVQNLRVKNNKNYSVKLVMSASGESTTCKIYSLSN